MIYEHGDPGRTRRRPSTAVKEVRPKGAVVENDSLHSTLSGFSEKKVKIFLQEKIICLFCLISFTKARLYAH